MNPIHVSQKMKVTFNFLVAIVAFVFLFQFVVVYLRYPVTEEYELATFRSDTPDLMDDRFRRISSSFSNLGRDSKVSPVSAEIDDDNSVFDLDNELNKLPSEESIPHPIEIPSTHQPQDEVSSSTPISDGDRAAATSQVQSNDAPVSPLDPSHDVSHSEPEIPVFSNPSSTLEIESNSIGQTHFEPNHHPSFTNKEVNLQVEESGKTLESTPNPQIRDTSSREFVERDPSFPSLSPSLQTEFSLSPQNSEDSLTFNQGDSDSPLLPEVTSSTGGSPDFEPQLPIGPPPPPPQMEEILRLPQKDTLLLVMCYNRPNYLAKTLDNVLKYKPDSIPLIVSQDGNDINVENLIKSKYSSIVGHMQNHPRPIPEGLSPYFRGYGYIAQHYRFALTRAFDEMGFKRVILLEDDMEIAPDFFNYFSHFQQLLENDDSVFCISAWNDLGQSWLVEGANETNFRRTSYFPGLGWMLTKRLWQDELRDKWPTAFWDDWMRDNKQRRGRDCIYPEISRTYTFGLEGTSSGQFYNKYLAPMKLNDVSVDYSEISLDSLGKEEWENSLLRQISQSTEAKTVDDLLKSIEETDMMVLYYKGEEEYKSIGERFRIMTDFKDNAPRCSYHGISQFRVKGGLLTLVPRRTRSKVERETLLLVLCYNRPNYLAKTLDNVLKYKPDSIPLIVSQDGNDINVENLIKSKYSSTVGHMQNHPRPIPEGLPPHLRGYGYIAQHYRFALTRAFDEMGFKRVILLEDDMEIAPDFFNYFSHFQQLLENDDSVFCISAWNDLGQSWLVEGANETNFRRTSYFPGLGWMLTKRLWQDELRDKWPTAFWDDWMRDNKQRHGRDCIYPEISRTYTFGLEGTSSGQFYNKYLAPMKLNDVSVDYSEISLDSLGKEEWENSLLRQISQSTEAKTVDDLLKSIEETAMVLYYKDDKEYLEISNTLNVMVDFKDNAPRCSYHGISQFRVKGGLVTLVPRRTRSKAERETLLLVLCYNRPNYLAKTLDNVLKYKPDSIPLIVSQDGNDINVENLIKSKYSSTVGHMQNHPRPIPEGLSPHLRGYGYIAQHYRFALTRAFDEMGFKRVILLEDDMEIAPDFFNYFSHFQQLLENDDSVFCISAWNDLGQSWLVEGANETNFRRTSYFPGLGWMLTKRLWQDELRDKWPTAFWDDWMRDNKQRRGRDCIYPEISRTYTFGLEGTSSGQFYNNYLAPMKLNAVSVDYSEISLDSLGKEEWENSLLRQISQSTEAKTVDDLFEETDKTVLYYKDEEEYKSIGEQFRIMTDFKDNAPRCSYHGISQFRVKGGLLTLVPWREEETALVTEKD